MMREGLIYDYTLILGDNAMILGHRLSELCGHGPTLETDIACTNISLDLFGQVRSYFQYAAKLKGPSYDEDKIAYFRGEREFRNSILVEQPNVDFGHVICRQFLFDAYHKPLLTQLQNSKDETIAAIAQKSLKEVKYHTVFSSEWMKRLGDGTEESNRRMQNALNELYPYAGELTKPNSIEKEAFEAGIGADLEKVKEESDEFVQGVISAANLQVPEMPPRFAKGKDGYHSENLGFILSEFQSTQRAYPNLTW